MVLSQKVLTCERAPTQHSATYSFMMTLTTGVVFAGGSMMW